MFDVKIPTADLLETWFQQKVKVSKRRCLEKDGTTGLVISVINQEEKQGPAYSDRIEWKLIMYCFCVFCEGLSTGLIDLVDTFIPKRANQDLTKSQCQIIIFHE